jgi:Heterokaryon incompatibility protein Het-C
MRLLIMNLKVHEKILQDALDDGMTMSSQAFGWVTTANKLSDLYQLTPERHFDNAPDREMICDRWRKGVKVFFDRAIELSAPLSKEKQRPKNRKGALKAFGAATHALADFYAHTNWVELSAAQGNWEELAPLSGETCQSSDLPIELESGYFNLWYGLSGCPKVAGKLSPPRGYRYCHEQLAKDHPDRRHGADRIDVGYPTYHELSVRQATRATRQLWNVLHDGIVMRYRTDTTTDAEALFMKLAWGEDREVPLSSRG